MATKKLKIHKIFFATEDTEVTEKIATKRHKKHKMHFTAEFAEAAENILFF